MGLKKKIARALDELRARADSGSTTSQTERCAAEHGQRLEEQGRELEAARRAHETAAASFHDRLCGQANALSDLRDEWERARSALELSIESTAARAQHGGEQVLGLLAELRERVDVGQSALSNRLDDVARLAEVARERDGAAFESLRQELVSGQEALAQALAALQEDLARKGDAFKELRFEIQRVQDRMMRLAAAVEESRARSRATRRLAALAAIAGAGSLAIALWA
jgi:hypothetical protein